MAIWPIKIGRKTRPIIYQNYKKSWVYSYFAVKLKCKHAQKSKDPFFRADRDTTLERLQIWRNRNFKNRILTH